MASYSDLLNFDTSQQQVSSQQVSMANVLAQEERKASMIEVRTDHKSELRHFESNLRGAYYHEGSKTWNKIAGSKQWMNEEAVTQLMMLYDMFTSKIFKLTYFDQEDVSAEFTNAAKAIARFICYEPNKKGISRSDRYMLIMMNYDFIYALIRVPFDDMERTHWDTVHRVTETNLMRDDSSQQKGSGFNLFARNN